MKQSRSSNSNYRSSSSGSQAASSAGVPSMQSTISAPAPASTSSSRDASPVDVARPDPAADRVAARAYEIWEKDGRQEGRAQEHWFQAERELGAGRSLSDARE